MIAWRCQYSFQLGVVIIEVVIVVQKMFIGVIIARPVFIFVAVTDSLAAHNAEFVKRRTWAEADRHVHSSVVTRRLLTHPLLDTATHTRTQVLIRLPCSRTPHLATKWTTQLTTTSQHHSPTRFLPRSHTNIRIHAHTRLTHTSPTRTCKVTMATGHIINFAKKYVDAIEQNRRVSGLSGGGAERNRWRVYGSSTDFDLHGASSTGGGGGWRWFRGLHHVLARMCHRNYMNVRARTHTLTSLQFYFQASTSRLY